jgi:hypothetical protein
MAIGKEPSDEFDVNDNHHRNAQTQSIWAISPHAFLQAIHQLKIPQTMTITLVRSKGARQRRTYGSSLERREYEHLQEFAKSTWHP